MKKYLSLLLLFATAPSYAQEALYDESKVPDYTLPELLRTADGKAVTTRNAWETQRRPEILKLFAGQVYGKTPNKAIPIRFEVLSIDRRALDGKATRKQVRIHFSSTPPRWMDLLVYVPNAADKPVPAFLGLNFAGNHSIHPDPGIELTKSWVRNREDAKITDNRATDASRGGLAKRWPVEAILERGYAVATVYYGDIQPDRPDSFAEGIHPLFYERGQTERKDDEWGALGAWAWGLSRAMDYLETDRDIDNGKVAVTGHSRLGKAALWAGAQDERFALVVSNDSGEGGAALTRRRYGEQIKRINTSFPHWFAKNYRQYNDRENDLPVDFHQLIALIAPRPVYVASASEDQWADPKGEYLSAYHAAPVYALYGRPGLPTDTPPRAATPVGRETWTGYHMREGKHDVLLYDWTQFMNFADFHFGRK